MAPIDDAVPTLPRLGLLKCVSSQDSRPETLLTCVFCPIAPVSVLSVGHLPQQEPSHLVVVFGYQFNHICDIKMGPSLGVARSITVANFRLDKNITAPKQLV